MAAVAVSVITINNVTPTKIFDGPGTVFLTNPGGTTVIGGGSMTLTSGAIPAPFGIPISIGNENLFAMTDANTATIGVMIAMSTEMTATVPSATSVLSSATSVQLLNANSGRRMCSVRNDGTSTLFLGRGAAATITSPIAIAPGATWLAPCPVYTGVINGIWSTANGSARIEEIL